MYNDEIQSNGRYKGASAPVATTRKRKRRRRASAEAPSSLIALSAAKDQTPAASAPEDSSKAGKSKKTLRLFCLTAMRLH